VQPLLAELAGFGRQHDARDIEHDQRMLNITPETGQLLAILARAIDARRVLEIGTSNGYSTLWLASAVQGHVDTIDHAAHKLTMARANLERAGLIDVVTLHHGRALAVLPTLEPGFDLVFLDADRSSYLDYFEPIVSLLRPGGLLVTDNVLSHAHELTAFLARVKSDSRLDSVTVPIGKGEELTYKRP
jgi:predicted O-methyltransferase YrrM